MQCPTCNGYKGSWPKGYQHNAALEWEWCNACKGSGVIMEFLDFFDVENDEHLKAWAEMERNGSWPKGFLPGPIHFGTGWFSECLNKMASKWLESRLTREYLDAIPLLPMDEVLYGKKGSK